MALLSLGLLSGCGGADTPGQEPSIEAATGAFTLNPVWNFDDGEGISSRLYRCDWSAPSEYPAASCSVEPDWVLVGGGAEIEGLGNPGALLYGNAPSSDLTTWWAASKDHIYVYPHRVRAYAVGLKIAGMSAAELRSHIVFRSATSSGLVANPSAFLPPDGNIPLSVGAWASYSGPGQLLTWQHNGLAVSKDHVYSNPGKVSIYEISIPQYLANRFLQLNTAPFTSAQSHHVAGGYSAFCDGSSQPGVPVGVTGMATYDGAGRMMSALFPAVMSAGFTSGGLPGDAFPSPPFVVASCIVTKDHVYSDSGDGISFVSFLQGTPP